jgi:hypothetical protein
VADAGGPCWDLAKFATDGKRGHFRVIFISSWHNDDSIKTVSFKSMGNGRERARQIEDSLRSERDKKRKAAELVLNVLVTFLAVHRTEGQADELAARIPALVKLAKQQAANPATEH